MLGELPGALDDVMGTFTDGVICTNNVLILHATNSRQYLSKCFRLAAIKDNVTTFRQQTASSLTSSVIGQSIHGGGAMR